MSNITELVSREFFEKHPSIKLLDWIDKQPQWKEIHKHLDEWARKRNLPEVWSTWHPSDVATARAEAEAFVNYVQNLKAIAVELLAQLKAVEWRGYDNCRCPYCNRETHNDNCKLAASITKAEEFLKS